MGDEAIIHIIDDDESLRLSLDSLFRSVDLHTRLYASANEFFSASKPDVPSCLVLDVRLPGLSGLDLQAELVDRGSDIPVILMTGFGDIPMSVRGMKAGAVDFLTKPFRDQDMLDAVGAALKKDAARRAKSAGSSQLRQTYQTLSAREREVMALVVAGKLNKQIAGDLELAEITVKVHRAAAMRKMGARSLAELVRMSEALKSEMATSRD